MANSNYRKKCGNLIRPILNSPKPEGNSALMMRPSVT